ncbi:MAG: hypothetical protein IPL96_04165 [Holophagaceae bacterium]|nr:hypothetical protein [Holophagaceae bacterium]
MRTHTLGKTLSRAPSRRGERGYILALLLGFCAVMGILLLKGIPAINVEVQRELEDELIFRGEHMAKGIRTFQARTGGYPSNLDELNKMKPRLLREVDLKDPMNPKGEWDLVYAVQAGASGDTRGLPIVGVKSKIEKDSFKVYKGKSIYSDWAFLATDSLFNLPTSGPPSGKVGTGSGAQGGSGDAGGGSGSGGSPDKPK